MWRSGTVAVAAVAMVLAGTSAVQAGGGGRFTPGAAGAGDPYFPDSGNGGYDVKDYDLSFAYDPATGAITATARIRAEATQDLSSFDLDFLGPLVVDGVEVDGPARWRREGAQELIVTPRKGIVKGRTFTTTVAYHGVPQRIDDPALGTSGWIATSDGVMALNQPFGAATYYPVNDTPKDKATYSVTVTAPSDLTVLANGEKTREKTSRGRTTVTWRMRQPMASELAMLTIGKYNVTRGRTEAGVPSVTAVDTALDTGQGAGFFATTNTVTDWMQRTWGRYPFGSTGGIVDNVGVGYALETQGRSVYDIGTPGRLPSTGTIAHELAHQWFGDSVTPALWKDIWLNEGWATYNDWLYAEATGGRTAQAAFDAAYARAATNPSWQTVMGDPGRDGIYDWSSYTRGAMTLHVLRTTIGDAAFYRLGRAWVSRHEGGVVSTADFRALAEKVSGKDLDALFTTWVYTPGKPAL
ncbi:peptidase M1-like protein [Actinocorallia herbida]|uniref:Aminopeptidase N n=1 Tax=Actinocorallia herbida TaxID=58109 RepID=A0A3N1CT29_9ACTN|nr:M1 family metallopeptidase [Actinocorallia herbida]ROO84463.1 peptidase M1-like protein [Actinocorallia herbida]